MENWIPLFLIHNLTVVTTLHFFSFSCLYNFVVVNFHHLLGDPKAIL